MGRLSQSSFLTALDKHFSKVRTGGSLFITFKRCPPPPPPSLPPSPLCVGRCVRTGAAAWARPRATYASAVRA